MKKFAVFSGFLGSGKTTAMMALIRHFAERRTKAAMISNDLGHGVLLADHRLAQLHGCEAAELTDECICYQNENLAERLRAFYREGCELVISDIPGFGVGALEHVYHGLTEKYPGEFDLAPFTVLAEPGTVAALRTGAGGDLDYILNMQLAEADIIVLSKCDRIDDERRRADIEWLQKHYPAARVLGISALRGEGLEELSRALTEGHAFLRRPDIGYGGEAFCLAMGKMSEYYLQYHAEVCCDSFDGNTYLTDIAERIQEDIRDAGYEIPHLKLLAWSTEGDFGKVDLLGTDRPIEVDRRFLRPCTAVAVLLNASAVCPREILEKRITAAVREVSGAYRLELLIHKQECFDMGE